MSKYCNLLDQSHLKGQCQEIFCFWFFCMNQFPPSPDYTIRAVSNFFENSRRFSQLNGKNLKSEKFLWFHLDTFATGVADTSGKFAAGFVDTGGKFATGINNASETGRKISLPVSLIPVVHLDLQISPQIFAKIRNGLNGKLWGWGDWFMKKKPEKSKNLVTLSL